ncbi:MAG: molecular chaperone [Acidobacteriia bacterium]|nr:molecular chaperone [Terriglobia bacterium]
MIVVQREKGKEKDFFINAVQMVEVEGTTNIPTVLLYRRGAGVLIGSAALAAETPDQLNEDFKVDLGNINPESRTPRTPFITATGTPKSAAELTADFLHEVVKQARSWMAAQGFTKATSLLLAEPLALQGELVPADWLANYRSNLRRILIGKGFADIDFLPEPFAVFQYYRYGVRHPLVAQRLRHRALVVDFGGGTCDVCIIETNKEGDISQTLRNSRPLAAASKPVGGFFVNRVISEQLLSGCLPPNSSGKLKKGLESYTKWRRGKEDLRIYSTEYQNFIRRFHGLTYKVENPKLCLCRSITDWRLDAPLSLKVPVSVPADPFSEDAKIFNAVLSAMKLRELFVQRVWNQYLRPLIKQTLTRGKEELAGVPISVVLLSGGSANIRWLEELIRHEFGSEELAEAEVLRLPDYQEVVAKGLALECARRFYNQTGDFSSVTYNRLCLLLDADGTGCEPRPFVSRTNGLPKVQTTPGLLLPSASVLQSFVDQPMRWKVRLSHPPKHQLKYYFLRSSFDPGDIENLQNVEDQTLQTPPNCTFDAALQVELSVREDGTARPAFVYKTGRTESETIVARGKEFFLDMTYAPSGAAAPEAYMGLDFGTSNTSVSFVDQLSVQVSQRRSGESQWRELSDLADTLPYPLAAPLARYLTQTDPFWLVDAAFDFVEAALALAAYTVYLEYCTTKGRSQTKLFKGLTQRSAGPLWHFLRDCVAHAAGTELISAPYKELLTSELFNQIDGAVTLWPKVKHKKVHQTSVDHLRPVTILANISNQVFSKTVFGFFEGVQKQKFGTRFKGLFRHAHGKPPFVRTSLYEGDKPFAEVEALLVSLESGEILPLLPLIYWDCCDKHPELEPPGHCFLFDSPTKIEGAFSFKAVGCLCAGEVSQQNQYRFLADQLAVFRQYDPILERSVGSFSDVGT